MNKIAFGALASVAAFSLVLAGCSSDRAEPSSSGAASVDSSSGAKDPVTITYWSRWPESRQALEKTIADFEKEYPYIHVDFPDIASSQYTAQLQAAVSSNSLPDIFANSASVPIDQLNRLGLIRNLDDVLTEDRKQQFYEGTWTEGYTTLDGSVYALPHFTPRRYSHMLYYNKDVLAKAGLTENDVPKSWDDLEKVARRSGRSEAMSIRSFWASRRIGSSPAMWERWRRRSSRKSCRTAGST